MTTQQFHDYDMVQATRRISDNILAGCVGTVVMVLDPGRAYLVEFFDDNDRTLDVPCVTPNDIKAWSAEAQERMDLRRTTNHEQDN